MNPFNQINVLGSFAQETKGGTLPKHTDPINHPCGSTIKTRTALC